MINYKNTLPCPKVFNKYYSHWLPFSSTPTVRRYQYSSNNWNRNISYGTCYVMLYALIQLVGILKWLKYSFVIKRLFKKRTQMSQ